ncbi:MAG: hypothetical protein WDA53_00300 [Bacillota bacterium]
MKRNSLSVLFACMLVLALAVTGCSSQAKAPVVGSGQEAPYSYFKVAAINQEEPIMMRDQFLEIMGQVDGPIPYFYQEVVKFAGHHCAATAGAWSITKKALAALYPDGQVPERGQIIIHAPGPANEWYVGVFGDIFEFITGATADSGFPGSSFGEKYNRRDLLIYPDAPSGTPPPQMKWIWERRDTGAKVEVIYNLMLAQPPNTPDLEVLQAKIGADDPSVTESQLKSWQKTWNQRAAFVLDNADKLAGFFHVEKLN